MQTTTLKPIKSYEKLPQTPDTLKQKVIRPDHSSQNEWIAIHLVQFYNEISLLCAIISKICDSDTCPIMAAGRNAEYLWADDHLYKRPVQMAAIQYIDFLMEWVELNINDTRKFPLRNIQFCVLYGAQKHKKTRTLSVAREGPLFCIPYSRESEAPYSRS